MTLSSFEERQIDIALGGERRSVVNAILVSTEAFMNWLRRVLPHIWRALKLAMDIASVFSWVKSLFGF